ncbi:hypothetical protein Q3G72_013813 [Acer saccharum]|nr:hypothetical protein Q3G72_013813 [Acer saccharum]
MNLDIDLNLEERNKDTVEHANDNWEDDDYEKSLEPYKGMEFDSQDDAYSFYLKYSKFIGFGISKKSSRRSKISGEFIDVKIVCTRYGLKKEKDVSGTRHSQKVDCKAILHVKKNSNGKWYAHNFVKDHTHELFPAHAHYLPCHRSIDSSVKENIDTLHAVGVGTSKIYAAMAKKHGGYENIGFLEKDIRNHLDKERRLTLASGDAKAMLEHFMHMQEENPNFFYAMDLDEEQRLKNVFWVDAKSREDYKVFGDVVSFDTTYVTNKYKMPFAPFIGVNNHFQSILLGCALLVDETTSTFVWLMQTWVRAMGRKSPISILTDQDKAMKAAISIVFPNTRHRFCLWHIMRKIPEKLGHVIRENDNFMRIFNDCIYNSWLEEDFEKKMAAHD